MGGVEGGETSAGGERVPAVSPRALWFFLIYGFCAACPCEERAGHDAPCGLHRRGNYPPLAGSGGSRREFVLPPVSEKKKAGVISISGS